MEISIPFIKKFIEILDKNELDMDIHEADVKEPLNILSIVLL